MTWAVTSGTEYTTGPQTFSFSSGVATIAVPNTAAVNDMVVFSTTAAGFTAGVTYYVQSTGLTTAALQLGTAPGSGTVTPNATTTATGTFEHIAVTDTTNNTFYAQVDTSAIAPVTSTSGICLDLVEFRLYTLDTGGSTYIQTWKGTYQFPQINNQKAAPFVPSDAGIRLTMKQLNIALTGTLPTVTFAASTTVTNATPATNNFQVGDVIVFSNSGGALPSPITAGTAYFIQAVLSGSTFSVASSGGGSAISVSGAGTGTHSYQLIGRPFPWKLLKQ
jgi:hypothetical protein